MKLLHYLRSTPFMVYVTLLTVLSMTPNTYYVYYSFSVFLPGYREFFSAIIALIVAASIMIFTVRSNERVAYYFALFEVVISGYYYISTIGFDWGLVPGIGFTLMLPLSVYFYTKELPSESASDITPIIEQKVVEELKDTNIKMNEIIPRRKPYTRGTDHKNDALSYSPTAQEMADFLNANPTKRPDQFKRA